MSKPLQFPSQPQQTSSKQPQAQPQVVPTLADITNTLTTLVARYCLAHAQIHPVMQKRLLMTLQEIFPFDNGPQKTPADIQLIITRHAQELLDEIKILMLRESVPGAATSN